MASSRSWPFDDDDRLSGSMRPLSQADLQAILAHLGDDPDQLLAGTGADRPVVAVRVRASVGQPGGSAQATWRRARAAEWTAWTRTLPWRMATTICIGAGGGVVRVGGAVNEAPPGEDPALQRRVPERDAGVQDRHRHPGAGPSARTSDVGRDARRGAGEALEAKLLSVP